VKALIAIESAGRREWGLVGLLPPEGENASIMVRNARGPGSRVG
jgi:hypothetical protein